MLEQAAGQNYVGALAGRVDEIAPRGAQDEIEHENEDDADRENPKRLDGVVGNDAIVDVHYENRARQREQIDDHRSEDCVGIDPPKAGQGSPEPRPLMLFADFLRAIVEAILGLREENEPIVLARQFREIYRRCAGSRLRQDDLCLACHWNRGDHASAAALQQKDARHVERRDLREIALDESGDDAGPLGRANEEIGRELLIDQRQTGAQGLRRNWPLQQPRKDRKTAQESGIGRLGAGQELRGASRRALVFCIRSAGAPSRCDGLNDSHWRAYRKSLGGNPPGLSRGPSEQGIGGEAFHRPRPPFTIKAAALPSD